MFLIRCKGLKTHITTANTFARVLVDLRDRNILTMDADTVIEKCKPQNNEEGLRCDFFFDFGGMVCTDWPKWRIVLDSGLAIEGWEHHLEMLIEWIQLRLDQDDRGGWVKLHFQWNCLCVTVEECREILRGINSLSTNFNIDAAMEDIHNRIGRGSAAVG